MMGLKKSSKKMNEAHGFLAEDEVTPAFLAEALRAAYFEISNEDQSGFDILITQYRASIRFLEDKKIISLRCVDRVADYREDLYQHLLHAVNNANSEIISVCSSLREYQDSEDHLILLDVEQYISYRYGLIMPQFVSLIKNFEQIDVCVFRDYLMRGVESFEMMEKEITQIESGRIN